MDHIRIALSKGRLEPEEIELLEEVGMDCSPLKKKSRKLVFDIPQKKIQIVLLKAVDVPTYVEHGVVDMGIVGKDILLEQGKELYEIADLGFGRCKLAVAGKPEARQHCKKHMWIATKYPNIAKQFFVQKGQSMEIIKQESSVELAPTERHLPSH